MYVLLQIATLVKTRGKKILGFGTFLTLGNCDYESARWDGFNGIYHDYIWNEKYFFNYDIIRYCDVISGTLQKWPYCYFENLSHTNSYPTIRLQITFCTRLPGPKKRQKRAFSPITPRIWDFSDEFSKIGREPIKPSGMMWTDKRKSAKGHNFPNGHNNETDYRSLALRAGDTHSGFNLHDAA